MEFYPKLVETPLLITFNDDAFPAPLMANNFSTGNLRPYYIYIYMLYNNAL